MADPSVARSPRPRALPDDRPRLCAGRTARRGNPARLGHRRAAGRRRGRPDRHPRLRGAEVHLLPALPLLRSASRRARSSSADCAAADCRRRRSRVLLCGTGLATAYVVSRVLRLRRRHRGGLDRRSADRVGGRRHRRRGAREARSRSGGEADLDGARDRRLRGHLPGGTRLDDLRALAPRAASARRGPRRRVQEARGGDGHRARGGRRRVGLLPVHRARL